MKKCLVTIYVLCHFIIAALVFLIIFVLVSVYLLIYIFVADEKER
jgi:hypothetical protein